MARRRVKHLYRYGAKNKSKRKFEQKYGRKQGDYIFDAVVGKVKRERMRKHRR